MAFLRNQVHDHFLSEGNTRWLHATIQDRLTEMLAGVEGNASAGTPVKVPLDDFFLVEMQQVADNSLNPPQGTLGLAAMNRTFINRMLTNLWQGLTRSMLYNQYELSQNRPRTHPYGQYTAKDGNVTISSSAYNMSHPWSKQQDSFLMATTGLQASGKVSMSAPQQQSRGQMFVDTEHYCRGNLGQQFAALHQ